MRAPLRLIAFALPVVCLALLVRSADAAETMLYDVTSVTFAALLNTTPVLTPGGTARLEIVDNGPDTPDGTPRWASETGHFAVWDQAPADLSTPDLHVFGNHCADIGQVADVTPVARVVQDQYGDGNFAWLSGLRPDGVRDPYAFFCLKGSHQSTTTWSEWVFIGKRVYAAPPPPSPVKVFITQPKAGATVSGTVWVVLWAEETSGASNVFTLSADAQQIRTVTTSSRGPVTIPWPTKPVGTTPVPNGTHTLTGTVRDATGKTGTTSITVILKN